MQPTRRRTASLVLSLGLAVTLVVFVGQALVPAPLAAAADRLPNLKMRPLTDWKLEVVNGRRLLRFTTIMVNRGPGHFEVRGSRPSTSVSRMEIDQIIFNDGGGFRRRSTGSYGTYAGDGHDHWHVNGIMTYEMYRAGDRTQTRAGAKAGFCFFDTTKWRVGLPGARKFPYYQEEWCGTQQTLANRVGISVGWGDRYPWNFAYQWIDVTNLLGGRYIVRSTVDIQDWFRETNEYDNCRWARIRIPDPGAGNTVTVLDTGTNCGRAAITAVDTFPGAREYQPPRRLSFEAGTYTGYTYNALGTRLRELSFTLGSPSGASAARRARIPGQPGRWFYVVDGVWDGYWIRDTARVDLVD